MDLDDQELWYTQFHKHLYKEADLIDFKKKYIAIILKNNKTRTNKAETQDLLQRLDLINAKLAKIKKDKEDNER